MRRLLFILALTGMLICLAPGTYSPVHAKFVPANAPAVAQNQAIDKTYSELSSMITASTLAPGQHYRITDFRTYHLIPNTVSYNTGTIEPLLVMAVAANALAPEAVSATHPQDVILYQFSDSSADGGDRGKIIYREDTVKRIQAGYDWRAVKFRRWFSVADNEYTVLADNAEASQDYYTFAPALVADGSISGVILPRSGDLTLANNVFRGVVNDCVFLGRAYDNTVIGTLALVTSSYLFASTYVAVDNQIVDVAINAFFVGNRITGLGAINESTISAYFENNTVSAPIGDSHFSGYITGCTFNSPDILETNFMSSMRAVTFNGSIRRSFIYATLNSTTVGVNLIDKIVDGGNSSHLTL